MLDVVMINPDPEIITPVHCFPPLTSRTTESWASAMPSISVGVAVGVGVGAGVGVAVGVGVSVGVAVGVGVGVSAGVGVGGTAVSVGVGGIGATVGSAVAHAATKKNRPTTAGARNASRRSVIRSARVDS